MADDDQAVDHDDSVEDDGGPADETPIAEARADEQPADGESTNDATPPDALDETTTTLPRVFSLSFSGTGVAVAGLFYAFSLFASLLPRTSLFQGIVSGVAVVVGYGIGAGAQWVWDYIGIPKPTGRTKRITVGILLALIGFAVLSATWQHVGWQNDVRMIFGMDSVSPTVWPMILIVAAAVAALLLVISRSVWKLFALIARFLSRRVSVRFARVVGGLGIALVAWLFFTGVLVNTFFGVANAMFSTRDTVTAEGVTQPDSPNRSGSPESLVAWDTLGRQGRSFVGTGPTVEDLDEFNGGGAMEPIRVYAGLKSAATLQGRADLLLDELIRTGAFDREILVVATTTGTGFLDPMAVDPLEYIHNGDTAIAGVQYSYLPSWISLLADQEVTRQTSRTVFDTVHDHWSNLPESDRPELYLYGLSLGSFGVEAILSSIQIVNEPIDGALMSGPPFVNPLHNEIEENRDEGSPPWRPIFEDGRTVRFMNQDNGLDIPTGDWGPTRLVYLQYGSDPVVNFSQDLLLSRPDWLEDDQRPPDVSEEMVWTPLVTMWQVLLDLPAAGTVPVGYGHLYGPKSNADAWVGVTGADWTADDTTRLAEFLQARGVG